MEPVGLAVGVVGLAGLFSTCVDCFELVQNGRYLGRDYILLEAKFENLKLRFWWWGRACGLVGSVELDARLDDAAIRSGIETTLDNLIHLFKDGSRLQKRYGLKDEWNTSMLGDIIPRIAAPGLSMLTKSIPLGSAQLSARMDRFKERIELTNKGAGGVRKARWSIEDKAKFGELITDLKDLIEDLERMTQWQDITRRQQQGLQHAIESIQEVEQLWAFGQARVSCYDVVSEVATLRLSQIQDSVPKANEASMSSNTSAPDESMDSSAAEPEWDDMTRDLDGGFDHFKVPKYLILNKVECGCQPEHSYFDAPRYRHEIKTTNDWVLLHDATTSGQLHLSGKEVLTHTKRSLIQNQVQFLVTKHFSCEHGFDHSIEEETEHSKVSVQLLSKEICQSLKRLSDFCHLRLPVKSTPGITLEGPFVWYYHGRSEITDYLNVGPIEEPIGDLFRVLNSLLADEYTVIDQLLEERTIRWQYIQYLFVPGEAVIRNFSPNARDAEGYELTDWLREGPDGLTLPVSCIHLDDKPNRYDGMIVLPPPSTNGAEARIIPLEELSILPSKFTNASIQDHLRHRANFLQNLKSRMLLQDKNSQSSRNWYMLDPALSEIESFLTNKLAGFALSHENAQSFVADVGLLYPSKLVVFSSEQRTWQTMQVSQLQPAKWETYPLEGIRLETEDKETLVAICAQLPREKAHGNRHKSSTLSFRGLPGTGKTSGVYALAQHLRRPVIELQPGDFTVKQFEQNLLMGLIWNVIFTVNFAAFFEDEAYYSTAETTEIGRTLTAFQKRMASYPSILILRFSTATQGQGELFQQDEGMLDKGSELY
ncbi:hypothetical protein JX266_003518 [Neoarthrinium moseri]|nr:hypothetical protein JX266_003518 [Neoarthrinium moseri]